MSNRILFHLTDPAASARSYKRIRCQKPAELEFGRSLITSDPDGHRMRVYIVAEGA